MAETKTILYKDLRERKPKKRRGLIKRLERELTVKGLRSKLDEVFSFYIRQRDKRCFSESGDCNGPIQAGHLITRGATRTRWDDMNCFGSCRKHNFLHEYRPEIMTAWFVAKYGISLYNELVQLSRVIWKVTRPELQELISLYERKTELQDFTTNKRNGIKSK